LGWLGWDGRRWAECSEESVGEAVRQWALAQFAHVATGGDIDAINAWRRVLSLGKQRAALSLARGIVEVRSDDLDAHPDLLNTPSGVVDLRTGDLQAHDPDLRLTKLTSGSYRPGFTHQDWEQALEALPAQVRAWMQVRLGQAASGHTTPDGIMPVCQGGGENGKSLLTTDGTVPALGDYASMASAKLFAAGKGTEHSTERADLRGRRLLVAEELSEGRSIDVAALKQIQDVGRIKARMIRRDNIEFATSHSLFTTTNYVPIVSETDWGTWRRLALVRFPYTFRSNPEDVVAPTDRLGDPDLKARIRANATGQHDAIVTWLVNGAVVWYQAGASTLRTPPSVAADTLAWRAEADRVLGYWQERIIADPDWCVLSNEMLDDFNEWLDDNGHNAWAKETFAPRFEGHSETVRNRVTKKQTRKLDAVSRKHRLPALGSVARVWAGVRFRTPADQQEDDDCHNRTDPMGKPADSTYARENLKGRDGCDAATTATEDGQSRVCCDGPHNANDCAECPFGPNATLGGVR
jgi:putative DNA primase/helicase